MKKTFFFSLILLLFLGCAMNPAFVGPPKKVYLKPFDNLTVQYSLHGLLTDYTKDEFLRDSYLTVVNDLEAEYIVSGEVSTYELRPISYSLDNRVESYEIFIETKIRIFDKINNLQILEETISGDDIYFTKDGNPLETRSNSELEKETQDRVLEYMSRDITRKVVYAKREI